MKSFKDSRTQEDKDFILSYVDEPYSIENFIDQKDVNELIDIWENSDNKEHKNIGVFINLKHRLFMSNETFRSSKVPFGIIINMIKCLSFSEVVAKDSGAKDIHFMRNTINSFIDSYIYE